MTAAAMPFKPYHNWSCRFWVIFGGQSLSLVGSALTQFVLLWWITDTHGSMRDLALAGVFALLPQAILAPLGGALADRYSRRWLMIIADLISALCMLVLIVLFAVQQVVLWHVYTMLALRSAMQAIQAPAASASVSQLVPVHFLARAAGLSQMMQSLTVIAAAPLGASVLAYLPLQWALAIDVATAVIGILPLLYWPIPQPVLAAQDYATPAKQIWHDLRDGVRTTWSQAGLRHLFGLIALVVLIVMPSMTLLPLLVKQYFAGGAAQVAVMESCAGIGMLLAAALVTLRPLRQHLLWLLSGLAASCASLALTALTPCNWFEVATLCWSISGLTYVLGITPLTVILQHQIAPDMQGRVLALLQSMSAFAGPIGLLLAAPLGELLGVRMLFITVGCAGAAVCLAGFRSRPLMALAQ